MQYTVLGIQFWSIKCTTATDTQKFWSFPFLLGLPSHQAFSSSDASGKRQGKLKIKKLLKVARYIRWTRALQYNQQSKSEVKEICIYENMESGRHSIYVKINSGFHDRKNPKQQHLKVVTFSNTSFSKKYIYVYNHAA